MTSATIESSSDSEASALLAGLRDTPRRISPKYFYDEVGSRLFDRICTLPEYYPTRTELSILRACASDLLDLVSPVEAVIEFGSGSSTKTRVLLSALPRGALYVPVDISKSHLETTAAQLSQDFPAIDVIPIAADYTQPLSFPARVQHTTRRLVFFPGSTIGNFEPAQAEQFLRRLGDAAGTDGVVVVGVDLVKDRGTLERAYDDSAGVTARFNRNILVHVNRLFEGNFAPEQFEHRALFDAASSRIEMRLIAKEAQDVRVAGETISLKPGEAIVTEHSYKYTIPGFAALAERAGLRVEQVWTDPNELFSVQSLRHPPLADAESGQ